jgi:hypothetical protein
MNLRGDITPAFSNTGTGPGEKSALQRALEGILFNSASGIVESTADDAGMVASLASVLADPIRSGEAAGRSVRQALPAISQGVSNFVSQPPSEMLSSAGALGNAALKAIQQGVEERGIGGVASATDFVPAGMLAGALPLLADLGKVAKEVPKNFYEQNTPISKNLTGRANENRAKFREGGETIITDEQPINKTIRTPEEMVGFTGVPVVGDRTRGTGSLWQVNGVPTAWPVPLQGGPDFPFLNDAGWASMEGAATSKFANATKAADATDNPLLGTYVTMSPEAANFSHHVIESMMAQLPALDVTKGDVALFDKVMDTAVRKANDARKPDKFGNMPEAAPKFVGLEHPEAMDQILGRGEYPREGAGALRKVLVAEMKKTDFINRGFPIYRDVQNAITKPELKGVDTGQAGSSLFHLDPNVPNSELSLDQHNSYNRAISPGKDRGFGGLSEPVPWQVMFPKMHLELAQRRNKKGKLLSPAEQLGSLRSAHLWEVFDEEWLEHITGWLERAANKGKPGAAMAAILMGAAAANEMGIEPESD